MFEGLLAIWLTIAFPAYNCWMSLRGGHRDQVKSRRYLRTIVAVFAPMVFLVAIWLFKGRTTADLGLDPPLRAAAVVGLCVAATIVLTAALSLILSKSRLTNAKAISLLPQRRADLAPFVGFSLTVGIGWEVLYRGYLLWFLTPIVGVVGAVVVASVAYGLAHGISKPQRVLGSLVASVLFTTGYAVTHSLWWLMLIHTALPAITALASLRSGPVAIVE